jgi:hypothetical protein
MRKGHFQLKSGRSWWHKDNYDDHNLTPVMMKTSNCCYLASFLGQGQKIVKERKAEKERDSIKKDENPILILLHRRILLGERLRIKCNETPTISSK